MRLDASAAAQASCGAFWHHPGDHEELTDFAQDRISRPLPDVVAVDAGEVLILPASAPAETVVVHGGQHQVPFTGADGEAVQVDQDRGTVAVAQDVADARIAMDDSLREDELKARVGVPEPGQHRDEEGPVLRDQPRVHVDPLSPMRR